MLDVAYQTGTDAVLLDMAQRPQAPKPQAPAFSLWGMLRAAPRGSAAGAGEAIGSTADILGAFGDVLATTEASAGGMFATQTEDERRQSRAAVEKLRTEGVDFNSEAGRLFRNVAKDYMPDPVTSHAAEQAVAQLFRLGTKAVGAGALLGPAVGAVVAGAEEGFTVADTLGQQGVDLATRSGVGAATAALTAFGFALPVAGQTVKGTVGLALAGGPASFVAQQAATREILASADYSQLADQYDPLDPVGLALSTLLPLGFGALALRARRGAPAEAVDAARVNLLRENIEAARLSPAEDLAAAGLHQTAVSRAIDQIAGGQRVEVGDVIPAAIAVRAVDELAPRLRALQAEIEPLLAARAAEPVVQPAPLDMQTAPAAELAPKAEGGAKFPTESPALDRQALELEASAPDLQVQLDGMDAPAPLSELMAKVRQEAEAELAEVPLLEAAANCFLRAGAGA